MTENQCCKSCKWLEVPPNKAGRRVVRKDASYKCLVPVPEIKLPDCITNTFGFHHPNTLSRVWMWGGGGTHCPLWTERIKP